MRTLYLFPLIYASCGTNLACAQQAPIISSVIPSIIWTKNTIDGPMRPDFSLNANDQLRTRRSARNRRSMHPWLEYRLNRDRSGPLVAVRIAHARPMFGGGYVFRF